MKSTVDNNIVARIDTISPAQELQCAAIDGGRAVVDVRLVIAESVPDRYAMPIFRLSRGWRNASFLCETMPQNRFCLCHGSVLVIRLKILAVSLSFSTPRAARLPKYLAWRINLWKPEPYHDYTRHTSTTAPCDASTRASYHTNHSGQTHVFWAGNWRMERLETK
jgi:hypothetical protein